MPHRIILYKKQDYSPVTNIVNGYFGRIKVIVVKLLPRASHLRRDLFAFQGLLNRTFDQKFNGHFYAN